MKDYWYPEDKNIIGPRIKEARMRQYPKLTQEQLAGELTERGVDLDRIAISHIESGKRIVADFEAAEISKVLQVSIAWLFDEEDE